MKKNLLVIFMLMLSMQQGFCAAKIDAQPGKWEIFSQMQFPGLPIKIPAIKQSQCISAEDLVPKGVHQQKNCSVFDINISSNTVSWAMKCQTKAGEVAGKGNVTYQKTSFTGSFQMDMPGPDGKMNMSSKLKGRYIGPCQ